MPDLHVEARIAAEHDESIDIQWSLENRGPHDLIVLDQLFRAFDDDGRPNPEPNLVYISADADGNVHVAKKVIPMPQRGIHVATPFVPLGRPLAAGARLEAALSLIVPIQCWDPYSELMRRHRGYGAVETVEGRLIDFEFGVLRPDGENVLAWIETEGGSLAYPHYENALRAQVTVRCPPLPWTGKVYR